MSPRKRPFGIPPKPITNLQPRNTLAVARDGNRVSLTIMCPDVAEALALYREVCDGAKLGLVTLDVETKPRPIIDNEPVRSG